MEQQIETLTNLMLEHCGGKDARVVIASAFNVAQTALNYVPDKRMLTAIAATLRDQVSMVDAMATGPRH